MLGNVFEDLVAPGSIVSKLLSVPVAGDENVFKLALWVVLFVLFFYAGTNIIFKRPDQRKVAGFIAAFIALIGTWFFNIDQLKNIGVVYSTLIFFALYLIPIIAVFYFMYGKWGNEENPFKDPTTLNFALKALFSGILLWLMGTLAKQVGISSFSGSRSALIQKILVVQPWVNDITAYFFTILFLMMAYYIIRFIFSLFGEVFGGGASEGENKFAAAAGRGTGSFVRGLGRGISGAGGEITKSPGLFRRGWNAVRGSSKDAENETKTELAGLKDTENQLEDIPNLLKRLEGHPDNKTINETARAIMQIVNSADLHERQFVSRLLKDIGKPIEKIEGFLEALEEDQTIAKLHHISSTQEFKSYPSELRERILNLLKEIPEETEKIQSLHKFFKERFGQSRGTFNRLVVDFNEEKKEVEIALRHSRYDRVAAHVKRMIEINHSIKSLLQEALGKERDLGKAMVSIEVPSNQLQAIKEGIAKMRGWSEQGNGVKTESKEDLMHYIKQTRDWIESIKKHPKMNREDQQKMNECLDLLKNAEGILSSDDTRGLKTADDLCRMAGRIAYELGKKL